MKTDKTEMLHCLQAINMAFHMQTIDAMERNHLAKAAMTRSLSEPDRSMLGEKIRENPDNIIISGIMDFFIPAACTDRAGL